MYEDYGEQGLQVVGVNVPGLGGDTKEAVLEYVEQAEITFPVVFDEQGRAYNEYRVRGVPNLFFVDREGLLVQNQPGAMEQPQMEELIKRLVEEG
jgi:cytochrome c-type biogenesis protein